jgi:ribonuclease P protein component
VEPYLAMPTGESFARTKRLRRPAEFQRVFQHGRSVADSVVVIYGCANERGHGRLGLSVGRKLGNAPQRNHWKRLIREVYRRHASAVAGLDIVVIPRRGATCGYTDLARRLPGLIERLRKKLQKLP